MDSTCFESTHISKSPAINICMYNHNFSTDTIFLFFFWIIEEVSVPMHHWVDYYIWIFIGKHLNIPLYCSSSVPDSETNSSLLFWFVFLVSLQLDFTKAIIKRENWKQQQNLKKKTKNIAHGACVHSMYDSINYFGYVWSSLRSILIPAW